MVVDTLKSVKRPGFYTAGGEISMPLPSLSVGGLTLGLPLCDAQAKELKKVASRAPGRKHELLIHLSAQHGN